MLAGFPPDQIPRRPQSTARIPTGPSDPETILRILKANNKNLSTYKVADQSLNEESLPLINRMQPFPDAQLLDRKLSNGKLVGDFSCPLKNTLFSFPGH